MLVGITIYAADDSMVEQWQLDLLPNITAGLNLIAEIETKLDVDQEIMKRTAIEVFDGEEVLKMGLEEYILHVVAAEMPASYDIEALKAQAVAARTYAAKHMTGEAKCKSGHTICTDHTCCQAFITTEKLILQWGTGFAKYYEKVLTAVLDTQGEVITCDGELITAVYHSSSGGMTEDSEAVFAMALPYLVSVESAGEEESPQYMDEKIYSEKEFIEIVNKEFPQAKMSMVDGKIDIWGRTDSGRVKLVSLGDTVITGQQMRDAFKLHSTNFSFEIGGGQVKIICIGYGHGVGMSQCGANVMAESGSDYYEILKHYYTGVEVEKLNMED